MFLHLEIHNESIIDLSAPPGLAGLATSNPVQSQDSTVEMPVEATLF